MGSESTKQRLHKATFLKTLQVYECFSQSELFLGSCLSDNYLSGFQDSLNHVLEKPKLLSKSESFTALLQAAPVLLHPDSGSVSREKQDASYNQ